MTRRQLHLSSLDDIIAELDRLAGGGYEKAGQWDLAQVCDHLAYFVRGSLEGFADKVPWFVRVFVGRRLLHKLLQGEPIPEGIAIPDKLVPPPGGDAAAAVQGLKDLLERLKVQPQLHPSPFFGTLTRDQWLKLHILHANHHLSFLTPANV
ncbi:MAG: DUF1569 domain-containing protein [Sedimentisphaerales bacterium]|nr:DUF1569 domain-containing protein [Sedimentisphaerales bacterium]